MKDRVINRLKTIMTKEVPAEPVKINSPLSNNEYMFVTDPSFQVTRHEIEQSKRINQKTLPKTIKTANWFVPPFEHIAYGGIYTIFRFIEKLSAEGINNRIIIYYGPSDPKKPFNKNALRQQIKDNFQKLQNYELIIYGVDTHDINDLPTSDVAFCTLWTSAYLLLRFNKTRRKYYFIQDYEPLFFPAGPISALAESTYRFGFHGVVNTPGLLKAVEARHGIKGVSFVPAVDLTKYRFKYEDKPKRPVRIFFYARPNKPRNAFMLGVATIQKLLDQYGDKIEIITAGEEWNEADYGLEGKITNLGLLKTLAEVSNLYQTCDIGFVFMFTKHPSYQPFEFMASGIATVTNNNEDNTWLLKNRVNCLVSEPSPQAMADSIGELVDDSALRHKIVKNGYKLVSSNNWEEQLDKVWHWVERG